MSQLVVAPSSVWQVWPPRAGFVKSRAVTVYLEMGEPLSIEAPKETVAVVPALEAVTNEGVVGTSRGVTIVEVTAELYPT